MRVRRDRTQIGRNDDRLSLSAPPTTSSWRKFRQDLRRSWRQPPDKNHCFNPRPKARQSRSEMPLNHTGKLRFSRTWIWLYLRVKCKWLALNIIRRCESTVLITNEIHMDREVFWFIICSDNLSGTATTSVPL